MDTNDENDQNNVEIKSMNGEMVFHFVKSNQFRVVHVDGAFGGISPDGCFIEMAVYNERQAIPLQITHEINEGVIGAEKGRVGREGVVREVEFNAVLNSETAIVIANWLLQNVEVIKKFKVVKEGLNK